MNETIDQQPFKTSRPIIRMILLVALVMIIAGVIYYRSLAALPFALGVLATSGVNILLYKMIERTVLKVMYMDDPLAGKNTVTIHSMLRFLITGVVLAIIGVIHSYTTPPPISNPNRLYLEAWAVIFPNAPGALLTAPLISLWGALFGIFTLKLSLKLIGFLKLEKDGEHFVKYEDDIDSDKADKSIDISDDFGIQGDSETIRVPQNSDEQSVDY